MRGLQTIIAVTGLILLSACGFRPLYGDMGTGPSVSAELESIEVDTPSSALGIEMRNFLIDELTPRGKPLHARHRLKVARAARRQELAQRIDASTTRYDYVLQARYQLIDSASQKTIHDGQGTSRVPYDVVDSQFATVYARFDAESRAAEELSRNIRLRLALFFDASDPNAPKEPAKETSAEGL